MSQKYAAFDASGNITAYYDSEDSPVPGGVNAIAITDEQWLTCLNAQCQAAFYTVQDGALVAPAPLTTDQLAAQQGATAWLVYQANARARLAESDVTVLRCYENAVAVPTEWAAYRRALRDILNTVSGDATQPLPTLPAYPAGT